MIFADEGWGGKADEQLPRGATTKLQKTDAFRQLGYDRFTLHSGFIFPSVSWLKNH